MPRTKKITNQGSSKLQKELGRAMNHMDKAMRIIFNANPGRLSAPKAAATKKASGKKVAKKAKAQKRKTKKSVSSLVQNPIDKD